MTRKEFVEAWSSLEHGPEDAGAAVYDLITEHHHEVTIFLRNIEDGIQRLLNRTSDGF